MNPASRFAFLLRPWIFAPLAAAIYLATSIFILQATVADPEGRAVIVSGDARHYLEIAEDFAAGNWSMDYVAKRPHRQPLYSALLVPVITSTGRDLFLLSSVNILLATLTLLVLYAAVRSYSGNNAIAAAVTALYAINPFHMGQTTHHLLTEPLHVLLMIVMIFALLRYATSKQAGALLIAAAAAGLDYLARPNGLFVMAAMLAALVAAEGWKIIEARRLTPVRKLMRTSGLLVAAVGIFALITIPSWLPRLTEYGRPFHHGYLSNYLWVDTYKEGHVGQREAIYTWRDYVETHTPVDVVKRFVRGFWNVVFAIPFRAERPLPILFFLALAGVGIAVLRGPPEFRILLLFGALQLLPLIWTNLSNPTNRVPYAATFPLELAFATLFLIALRAWDWQALALRIRPLAAGTRR